MSWITKFGVCIKCGNEVYAEFLNYPKYTRNILLQECIKGGDCEVDILLTPLAKRNRFADEGL